MSARAPSNAYAIPPLVNVKHINRYYKGKIIDIHELTHLKIVALTTLDNKITFWNFFKNTYVFTMNLNLSVHSFSYNYY